jgi:hypothetical protein
MLRVAILGAVAVGSFSAIFFGFADSNRNSAIHPGPPVIYRYPYAKVSIPKGSSSIAIGTMIRYSPEWVTGLVPIREIRGQVALHAIPAGAPLTTSDFGLKSPLYYPRGYPKRVSASQTPAQMSGQLPARSYPSDLELAPGVWVNGKAFDDIDVANATLIGYCRSVRSFQAHNPDIPFATFCWRSRSSARPQVTYPSGT